MTQVEQAIRKETHVTQIDIAQAAARRRHDEYVKACQRVSDLVRKKEEKAKANIAKIRAAAEAKVAKVQDAIDSVKTADIAKCLQATNLAERAKLGLAS